MRAVHVYPTFVPSLREGITRNVHDLVERLPGHGIETRLEAPEATLEQLNNRVTHLTRGFQAHEVVASALEDESVDVVHYHVSFPAMGLFAGLARARAPDPSTPLVLHVWNAHYEAQDVHGTPDGTEVLQHRLFNGPRVARAALASGDGLVVSSRYQAHQLRQLGLDGRISVVPNGVDTDAFQPATETAKQQAREAFGLGEGPVVLYYGHLSTWKGVVHLVDALPRLFERAPETSMLISHTAYGDDDWLTDRLAKLGVDDRVTVVGPQDPSELQAAADIGVVPATAPIGTACHPNVLLEHQAAGLPVVASRVGSIPEVVTHGVTGLLVDPADPSALAQGLGMLAEDPAWREQMGQAARRRIEARFTWDQAAEGIQACYQGLLPSQPTSSVPVDRPARPSRPAAVER